MFLFSTYKKLKTLGVMGINDRNASYIMPYNPRSLFPLVDDKLATKKLALSHGIAVPQLYGVIAIEHDIKTLPKMIEHHENFVVKPAHGSGGEGIIVFKGRKKNRYRKTSGDYVSESELNYHLANTISGLYSLGGYRDQVLVEYCVEFDPLFEKITYQGVPDIRVIIFQGYPVMSMVRLPTRQSDGKANLHQGAVGVGIDLKTGITLNGVHGHERITHHPDTDNPLLGLPIPGWTNLLAIAAKCYEITGLGYIGVDLVLDRDLGPLMLELNARPGLNIQIANAAGLAHRLEYIKKHIETCAAPESIEARVAFSQTITSHLPK